MNESRPVFGLRPVVIGWLLTVGIDFFFNAGVFSGLFDQGREPGLLPDSQLFRRIPVAYVALAVGVAALAWLFDKTDLQGIWLGTRVGAAAGLVFAFLGVIGLWTAVEMTSLFVAAAGFVQVMEFAAAGAFLGAYRDDRTKPPTRVALTIALALVVVGIIVQNLMSS